MNNAEFMESTSTWKLIAKLSVPTVLITLVMAVYNMADIFFIGKTGNTDMVNAISVCMPVFTIVQAFGTLVGTGGCTAISLALGKNEKERPRQISAFCFWFCISLGLLLTIILNVFADVFLRLLGAADSYYAYAITYLRIIAYGCPVMLFSNAFVNILRADGSVKESMGANLSGTFFNIILDPILILKFNMGVEGAAIATVLGNILVMVIVGSVIRKKTQLLSITPRSISLKSENSFHVLALGFPVASGTLLVSIAYMLINNLLKAYDVNAQGAFGICRTIMLLSTMIQMGICMGTQPAISYNFGRKNMKKTKDIILKTGIISVSFGAVLAVVILPLRGSILPVFLDDPAVLVYAKRILIGCLCTAAVYGLYETCAATLQAMEHPILSTITTLLRQGIILIPMILILNSLFGYNGLIFCFAASDIFSAIIGLIFTSRSLNMNTFN